MEIGEKMQERIAELVKIINEANYNYHVLDNPTITDQEYDNYLRELYELEEKYPELVLPDSPTKKIGGEILDKFQKVIHEKPMMSLSDVFSYDEVMEYDNRIRKEGIKPQYMCELKIDGLSVSIKYENGFGLVKFTIKKKVIVKLLICKKYDVEFTCIKNIQKTILMVKS